MVFEQFFFSARDRHESGIELRNARAEKKSIPTSLPHRAKDVVEYGRLEDNLTIKHRPRTSKSLWSTWYPGNELSILVVAQRHLDAWMEILLEAGLDVADYGRREELLHPEGLSCSEYGQACIYFEYGDHVSGCRIHVTEVWIFGHPDEEAPPTLTSEKLPGTWDSDDESSSKETDDELGSGSSDDESDHCDSDDASGIWETDDELRSRNSDDE